ncbi:MAG TPA: 5-formyltetrahydrofolate cyclo-ligase [Bacillales bacterium]|nr:5-formyltetrahydrofolate cyclo-ligase [Bacillales bacterium]
MLKNEVRSIYRKKRDQITDTQKLKLDDLLLIQFQKLLLPPITYILSFIPIEENNEINTFIITDYLQFKNPGLHIAYPRIDMGTNLMQAIGIDENTVFKQNKYKIAEPSDGYILDPSDIDVVLVPLLAFDKHGNRVGYGKGYYDQFLRQCNNDCIKIGLCYFDAIDKIDDANQFDVPLNYCVTPQMIYVF